MKLFTRALCFGFGFVGCCCAGLLLIGGESCRLTMSNAPETVERDDGGKTAYRVYCPNYLYGQMQGVYYYTAWAQDMCSSPYLVNDMRMHTCDGCPNCSDPIIGTTHPVPVPEIELRNEQAPDLTPKADPLFSGVLR